MNEQITIEPRLLTKAQAAAYMSTTSRNYDRLRTAGLVPGYVLGMHRIDRVALDAAIDEMSGVSSAKPAAPEVDPLAKWSKEARAARKAAKAEANKGIAANR